MRNVLIYNIHATLFLGSSSNLKISKLRDFTTELFLVLNWLLSF